jgi:hypothetical protein
LTGYGWQAKEQPLGDWRNSIDHCLSIAVCFSVISNERKKSDLTFCPNPDEPEQKFVFGFSSSFSNSN